MIDANITKESAKKVTVVGFAPRLLAALIDGVMVSFLSFMLALVIGLIGIFTTLINTSQDSSTLQFLTISCVLVFSFVYYIGFWTNDGQTVGNAVVGLKVIRTDGSRLSTGRALLRYIGYIINAILFSIGFMWAAFDSKRQGWHDKLADTLVVYEETKFAAADAVDLIPSDQDRKGWIWGALWIITALFLPVGALSGLLTVGPFITVSLVNFIRNFI